MEQEIEAFAPDLARWEPWSPELIADRLARVTAPWCVAGGWAIDLFLGGSHRTHDDLEIAVPHDQFGVIAAALKDLEWFVVGDGLAWPIERAGRQGDLHHQTWARDTVTGRWRVDVFREPSANGRWVCRRDERIQLPYGQLIARTETGIPFVRPEVALLFKAKAARAKDETDFAAALPRLGPDARRWLRDALDLVHPGHPWIARIREEFDRPKIRQPFDR